MSQLFSLIGNPGDLLPEFSKSFEGLDKLINLYKEVENETSSLIIKTGLKCPYLCGKCCDTPSSNIEVTVFEMILPALELWKNGKVQPVFEKLAKATPASRCVLFAPLQNPDSGRCGMYQNRALICRLFGVAGHLDKYQKIQFTPCLEMRKQNPAEEIVVREMISKGLTMPVFSNYRERVYGLNPLLAERLYPINTALLRALRKVGYYLMYK